MSATRPAPATPRLFTIGDRAILDQPLLSFFCSRQCPGDVILRTYDLARELRDAAIPVIGGFHTAMERECLALLLRGKQPLVICPARGIEGMRLRPEWKGPVERGRLLIVSSFEKKERRPTADLADQRNRLVAEIARAAFIGHASPGGATSRVMRTLLQRGTPIWTFAGPANAALIQDGARELRSVIEIRDSMEEKNVANR